MKNPTHVLYHGNCPDGFGAAWAVWKKLTNNCEYIACTYGQPLPKLPSDARVLILDFSFARDVSEALASKVYEIKLLDHHQTAADALKGLPWCEFDMSHSGAYLAWKYIHGEPVPDFIRYVEDRDLWKFSLPYSREVAAGLASYPKVFTVWETLFEMGMDKLKLDGGTILRFQAQKVEEICEQAMWKNIGGCRVPVVNVSTLFSEVVDKLCVLNPQAPFAAYYFDRADGKRQWGLRSPGRFDVSAVAKANGSGGHPGTAGFVLDQRVEPK